MSSTTREARRRPRRFTLDATHLGGSDRSLTLADLRAFIEANEQFDPRVRSVTFELDDVVVDHS